MEQLLATIAGFGQDKHGGTNRLLVSLHSWSHSQSDPALKAPPAPPTAGSANCSPARPRRRQAPGTLDPAAIAPLRQSIILRFAAQRAWPETPTRTPTPPPCMHSPPDSSPASTAMPATSQSPPSPARLNAHRPPLEPGRASWTAVLDAVRLGPGDDENAVTAAQVRDVVTRLIMARALVRGDPVILVVFDAGYGVTRLSFLLSDLPVELLG
jgi:hypothetical protein